MRLNFICDSSSLISLVETCNLPALLYLKQKRNAVFLVPPAVVYEIVDNPEHIHRHAYSAMRLKRALREGILTPFESPSVHQKSREILQQANNLFSVNGVSLRILHPGEAECLAAYGESKARGILVDEKTTRLLIESPQLMLESLKQEYGDGVKVNQNALAKLQAMLDGFVALRSTEILAIAFEAGFFEPFKEDEEDAFHSAVYALRQSGCSITTHEMGEYEELHKKP